MGLRVAVEDEMIGLAMDKRNVHVFSQYSVTGFITTQTGTERGVGGRRLWT